MVDDGVMMCLFEEPAFVTIAQRVGSLMTLRLFVGILWGKPRSLRSWRIFTFRMFNPSVRVEDRRADPEGYLVTHSMACDCRE